MELVIAIPLCIALLGNFIVTLRCADEDITVVDDKQCQKRTKWTKEMKEDVLKFYHQTDSEVRKQSNKMKVLWDRKYPQYPRVTAHHLIVKARELQKKKGEEIVLKRIPLTTEEKKDVLRCYHEAQAEKGKCLKVVLDHFIRRHPERANISYNELRCHLFRLRKRNPEIDERISKEVSALKTMRQTWETGKVSTSRMEEPEFRPKYQIRGSPRVSQEYFNSNHTWGPGESSKSRQGELTSISTSQTHDIPGSSEQYFDPYRDNAWIDNMIQEASFSNLPDSPDESTDHRNIH